MTTKKLLDAVTSTVTGPTVHVSGVTSLGGNYPQHTARSFQSYIAGTGAVTATVLVEGSNDEVGWILMQTHTLSGTTTDVAGVPSSAQWEWVRARLTAISGTGAAVTVTMGV